MTVKRSGLCSGCEGADGHDGDEDEEDERECTGKPQESRHKKKGEERQRFSKS